MKTYKKRNPTKRSPKKRRTYKKKEYNSDSGMLTSIWGPSMWLYLHTMSFNYPINPTNKNKLHYKRFIETLQYVLPCGHCRKNYSKNLKSYPIKQCHLKNRNNFSRYIYKLHENINKMLGKKSELSYCDVRELYEHFRSRCGHNNLKSFKLNKTKKNDKGCTEPLYGKKAKCIIKIVPQEKKCKTFQIDKKCIKHKHKH